MDYKREYDRWMSNACDKELLTELRQMDEVTIEDAFYRDLAFGTGGLRGIIGAGTNRMNSYVVAKASQGLANYLGTGTSIVIGYDSRIKSDVFARVAAGVFAANGITVHIWPKLLPVPTVSYAVRNMVPDPFEKMLQLLQERYATFPCTRCLTKVFLSSYNSYIRIIFG